MASGVLEQVANHPPQQARIAVHDARRACDLDVVAGGFLGGERESGRPARSRRAIDGVEAAREQDLVDERVELGDVALERSFARGIDAFLEKLDGHADAGERRAQLVRGVREQRLVRTDQPLDALRRRRLKLSASRATSSRPSTLTRAERSPAPSACTPRCSRSRRCRQAAHHRVGAHARSRRGSGPGRRGPRAGRAGDAGRAPRASARRRAARPTPARARSAPPWRPARCGASMRSPTAASLLAVGAEEREIDASDRATGARAPPAAPRSTRRRAAGDCAPPWQSSPRSTRARRSCARPRPRAARTPPGSRPPRGRYAGTAGASGCCCLAKT